MNSTRDINSLMKDDGYEDHKGLTEKYILRRVSSRRTLISEDWLSLVELLLG